MLKFLSIWGICVAAVYLFMAIEAILCNRNFIVSCKRLYRTITEEEE